MMRRYVAIYFAVLYVRYRAGIVTDEMIALPKSRFMAIGILEALGVASGMASAGVVNDLKLTFVARILGGSIKRMLKVSLIV